MGNNESHSEEELNSECLDQEKKMITDESTPYEEFDSELLDQEKEKITNKRISSEKLYSQFRDPEKKMKTDEELNSQKKMVRDKNRPDEELYPECWDSNGILMDECSIIELEEELNRQYWAFENGDIRNIHEIIHTLPIYKNMLKFLYWIFKSKEPSIDIQKFAKWFRSYREVEYAESWGDEIEDHQYVAFPGETHKCPYKNLEKNPWISKPCAYCLGIYNAIKGKLYELYLASWYKDVSVSGPRLRYPVFALICCIFKYYDTINIQDSHSYDFMRNAIMLGLNPKMTTPLILEQYLKCYKLSKQGRVKHWQEEPLDAHIKPIHPANYMYTHDIDLKPGDDFRKCQGCQDLSNYLVMSFNEYKPYRGKYAKDDIINILL